MLFGLRDMGRSSPGGHPDCMVMMLFGEWSWCRRGGPDVEMLDGLGRDCE